MSRIGVIGAGPAGLITAKVLLDDGWDVELLTRDLSVGGVWAKERLYPDMAINNVHGEYRFSCLPMPPPQNASATGGRLSGDDLSNYFEKLANTFLSGRIRVQTDVQEILRGADGTWIIRAFDRVAQQPREFHYSKIVMSTGGCSVPKIPSEFNNPPESRDHFPGLVFHSSEFRKNLAPLMKDPSAKTVIVGGGKSAQDISRYLALKGRDVTVVFNETDAFLAFPFPLPAFIRRSRITGLMSPHRTLHTGLERFLHQTTIGSWVVHLYFWFMSWIAFRSFSIPSLSPLRKSKPIFWSIRLNDEGLARKDGYHSLAMNGTIKTIAPMRVAGFNSRGVTLADGTKLPADAVVLATGYQGSWDNIFSEETKEQVGLKREYVDTDPSLDQLWPYPSLGPAQIPDQRDAKRSLTTSCIHRGIVPAKNILQRDFAVNGAIYSSNNGYIFETTAHWIASYFRADTFLKLPSTVEEAMIESQVSAAWLRRRYPDMLSWVNQSYSADIAFLSWPQAADDLIRDMDLEPMRSGGNWLTWAFKEVHVEEIGGLGQERAIKRAQYKRQLHGKTLKN